MSEYQRYRQKKSSLPLMLILGAGVLVLAGVGAGLYLTVGKKTVAQVLSAQPTAEYGSTELMDAYRLGKVKAGDSVKVKGFLRSAEHAERKNLPKLTLDGGIGFTDMVDVVFDQPLPAGLKRGDVVTVTGTVKGPALETHGVLLESGTFIKSEPKK